MFDIVSVDYNPELSKPNALESIDKDYDSMTRKNSQKNLGDISFQSIRNDHKLMNGDVSLMTPMQTKEEYLHRFDYCSKSKSCIPKYNIKTIYNQSVTPFFSPTSKELDNLIYLSQSVNIEPEEKEV